MMKPLNEAIGKLGEQKKRKIYIRPAALQKCGKGRKETGKKEQDKPTE